VAIINPPPLANDNILQEAVSRVAELLPNLRLSQFSVFGDKKESLPAEETLLPQTATQEPIAASTPAEERLQAARQALINQQDLRTPEGIA